MNPPAPALQARVARFAPEMEQLFQARYYLNVRTTLRPAALVLAVLFLLYGVRTHFDQQPLWFVLSTSVPMVALFGILFGLSFARNFGRIWQPTTVVLCWAALGTSLYAVAARMAQMATDAVFKGFDPVATFGLQFAVLLVSLAALRLSFRWSALLYGGGLILALFALGLVLGPALPDPAWALWLFLQPSPFILFALLAVALVQERLARSVFLANVLLEEDRNDERRRREATEGKLQVLARAIGGIVHDLGNPLTSVQLGASTLDHFLNDGIDDRETLQEFTEIIASGATMLNFLRLSLIEQVRVLEGQPTPVELKPTSLRSIVQAGARFQKPNLLAGRAISIQDEDSSICADEMKMITVFMNLLGNALKYSVGEVRVAWRAFEEGSEKKLLVAVLDRGAKGRGITREQAGRLFTAFGRLESHEEIEGTGLGLLSVQKIAHAHGGEAFIEGFEDGAPPAPRFSTAEGKYPSMLSGEDRTAFVISCSLALRSEELGST